jgi:HlyD family secretion protein
MKLQLTTWMIAGAVALLAATPGSAQAPEAAGKPAKTGRAALSVSLISPLQQEWPQTLMANGALAPWQEVVIGAQTNALRIEQVMVDIGDRVVKGQVLATLRAAEIDNELAQSRASLAEAQVLAADAKEQADRARKIEASGTQALSAQQISQLLNTEKQTQVRVQLVQAQVQAVQLRLQNTRIVAPDEGVISARSASVGAMAQPGQDLFRLIRQSRIEWRAEVPGTVLRLLKPGQAVKVLLADGAAPVAGKIRMVAPTVDPQTRNGLVYVSLPLSSELRPGLFVRGEFATGSSTGLSIPQSAILQRDGFAYVFRLMPDNKVEQVKVQLGRRVAERVEVMAGAGASTITATTKLVASGVAFLSDGDQVKVVDSK